MVLKLEHALESRGDFVKMKIVPTVGPHSWEFLTSVGLGWRPKFLFLTSYYRLTLMLFQEVHTSGTSDLTFPD